MKSPSPLIRFAFYVMALLLPVSKGEIRDLTGDSDFRSVTIRWRNALPLYTGPLTFRIQTCELQAWGLTRCKSQSLEPFVKDLASSQWKWYSATVKDLRMSTNYIIEVQPVLLGPAGKRRAMGQVITVSTKSYSAKASQCLADASRIEVETGPHFSGKISVEDATDPKCSMAGKPNSTQHVYALTIDHQLCGSQPNGSLVTTYVLVQENLALITHTTRRFLVVCNYQPDTFVVQTGVQLPSRRDPTRDSQRPTGAWEVADETLESHSTRNDISNEVRSLQFLPQAVDVEERDSENRPQFVLMMVLLSTVLIGLCVGVGSFVIRQRRRFIQGKLCARHPSRTSNSSDILPIYQDTSQMTDKLSKMEPHVMFATHNPVSLSLPGDCDHSATSQSTIHLS